MTLTLIKNALISVSDKKGIIPLAQQLHQLGINLISTGGTCELLQKANIPVTDVSTITGFPEMMDGRLKTLHPKIHGGILGRRTIDQDIAIAHGIDWIDLVIVNLYPFAEVTQRLNVTFEEAIENIDIGGPAMIRSAAKNMADVLVVVDHKDYDQLLKQLNQEGGPTLAQRQHFAIKAFDYTAQYDALIHRYLKSTLKPPETNAEFPEQINLSLHKAIDLRYGENPDQKACAYQLETPAKGIFHAKQHQGKTLSYNNLLDANAAIDCLREFDELPSSVIVKHTNPCGIACAPSISEAFAKAFDSDSNSAFGGIVALNRTCDESTATAMINVFFEVIIAPNYTEEALKILSQKPNVRILELPFETKPSRWAYQWIEGGVLIQSKAEPSLYPSLVKVVTEQKPSPEMMNNLWFAWRAVKYIKSNAILIAKDYQSIGLGAGQVSRVDAVDIALRKSGDRLAKTVLASDAFFPFRDSIDRMANTGITAIIQPGGSIRDQEVIDACNEHGIAMLMTGLRCFKH
jgi:phosphoribosylaminoimidazolecarboxamide formyltransferase/IMP cyclohydrolase